MREPLVLEAADQADLEPLASLEKRCYTHPWTLRQFRAVLDDPGHGRVVVFRAAGEGSFPERGIRAYAVFQTIVDELHVHNLAVHPEHRGQGLGRRLMALVLGIGAGQGAETALLEVRQSNWPAQQLYRALGFETVGVRRSYYADPPEDALLLRKGDLKGAQNLVKTDS